ncbi:hypothetical protein NEOLEDRAFT_962827 [Neolentinus lepideus HHB14362 ss-1]|uniref:Uncharacterized protein n=1 Tax=Neolentinus lepideus HHB14362 ss-1 TaxID=1314782 RepID=A0A165UHA7_9AGAM|nr:hypothetical protein NEOLEDRAFT_962827 [Neolentinus lepideus HHB14362 ss-1]
MTTTQQRIPEVPGLIEELKQAHAALSEVDPKDVALGLSKWLTGKMDQGNDYTRRVRLATAMLCIKQQLPSKLVKILSTMRALQDFPWDTVDPASSVESLPAARQTRSKSRSEVKLWEPASMKCDKCAKNHFVCMVPANSDRAFSCQACVAGKIKCRMAKAPSTLGRGGTKHGKTERGRRRYCRGGQWSRYLKM